jgi:hypothetical protein
MKDSGLTAKVLKDGVTFEEAEVTLVCRKLFRQKLEESNMPADIAKEMYEGQASHDMYIGEVVEIIK